MVKKLVFQDSKGNIINIEIWNDNLRPICIRIIDRSGVKDVYWEDDPEEFESIVKKLEGYFSRLCRWMRYFKASVKDEAENPSPKVITEIPTPDTSEQPTHPDDEDDDDGEPAEGLAATVQTLRKWRKQGRSPFSR